MGDRGEIEIAGEAGWNCRGIARDARTAFFVAATSIFCGSEMRGQVISPRPTRARVAAFAAIARPMGDCINP